MWVGISICKIEKSFLYARYILPKIFLPVTFFLKERKKNLPVKFFLNFIENEGVVKPGSMYNACKRFNSEQFTLLDSGHSWQTDSFLVNINK